MDYSFLDTILKFKITSRKHRIADDDLWCRFNRYYTTIVIIIFSLVICMKQYIVGDPLQCWVPAQFPSAWEEFAETYCWVKNTYFVSPSNEIPRNATGRTKDEIGYYQWVPFVLAIQAIFFLFPSIYWRIMNWQSGVQIKTLVGLASDATTISSQKRDENLTTLAQHLCFSLIETPIKKDTSKCVKCYNYIASYLFCNFRKTGDFLTNVYIITKILYLINGLLQLLIVKFFLGTHYYDVGMQVLNHLLKGLTWRENGHFPRVTFCDFSIRVLGNVQRYTIQCVLVINLFNEKIYIFLWFWFVFITLINVVSCVTWIVKRITVSWSKTYLYNFLLEESYKRSHVELFCNNLYVDAIFVLSMIENNCGHFTKEKTIKKMFKTYMELCKANNDDDGSDNDVLNEGDTMEKDNIPLKTEI